MRIVMLLLVAASAFASGSIETGYLLRAADILNEETFVDYGWRPYVELGVAWTITELVTVGGLMRTVIDVKDIVTYAALMNRYTVYAEARIADVTFGAIHYCEHMPGRMDRSEERLYVKIQF